ncbi:hypothetical protein I4U23_009218 [Adineta vaga]|nr:hypothetical protein I4U23_009218 [Adineta vaga]
MSNRSISWTPEESYSNTICLILLLPTFILHILFWIQVCTFKTLHDASLLWIYNYLILDMISLCQILLEYITRHSTVWNVSSLGFNILCTLEAYTNNFTTMVQSFALILTNIYRYRLIVKKKKILKSSILYLIIIHLCIYSLPLSIFIMQYIFSRAKLVIIDGISCDVEYSAFIDQFVNIFFLIIIPTLINIPVIIIIIRHVQASQNAVQSVRRIHRHLIIQFIVLYTIWLLFFLPQIIFLLSITSSASQRLITKILDMMAILFDVLVITLFDRRFVKVWKMNARRILLICQRRQRQVNPVSLQRSQLPRTL